MTSAAKLRAMAERLRADDGPATRSDAAQVLDQLAGVVEKARNRLVRWTGRGFIAAVAATLAMVVAGIWADGRWLATASVPAVAAAVLWAMNYVGREGDDA